MNIILLFWIFFSVSLFFYFRKKLYNNDDQKLQSIKEHVVNSTDNDPL